MPPPVRSARHRSREGFPCTPTPDTHSSSAPPAVESGAQDYAARDPNEVAAHFPVPSAEVAARLVDLLLPRRPVWPKGDEAA
jgi:hypothetical protein